MKSFVACVVCLFLLANQSVSAAVYDIYSFEDLNTKALSADSSDTLNIVNDIVLQGDLNSFASDNLIIQGSSQHTLIDGQSYHGFNFNKQPSEITFKNLKITGFAGAVEFGKGTLNIDNVTFDNNILHGTNSSNARGTVINLNNSKQSAYIKNSHFVNNKLISTGDAMSAVIFSNAKLLDISGSTFENNTVDCFAAFGGSIFADGSSSDSSGYVLNIDNTNFKNNTINASYLAAGAAIQAQNLEELNITNAVFENNGGKAPSSTGLGAGGGAISASDVKKTTIRDSKFINNYVEGYKLAEGGAIDVNGEIIIYNSDFIGNYVKSDVYAIGGAISNFDTLTIVADNKDVLFDGNKANDVLNAIYNGDGAVLNLNASSGNKIIFNDSITSDSAVLNVNKNDPALPADGTIFLNADMSGYLGEVNVFGGTLQIGEKGNLFDKASSLTFNNGSNIDLKNGLTQTSSISNLILKGTSSVAIDADFAAGAVDSFNILSSSGDGVLKISDIAFINDSSVESGHIEHEFVSGSGINLALDNSIQTILTSNSKYDIALNGSRLVLDKSKYDEGLVGAVGYSGERQYQMSSNEIITNWTPATQSDMQGTSLVIKGNENSIMGNGNKGLVVNSSQSLTLENVASVNGFISDKGGAIYNNQGILNIVVSSGNMVFENNTASSFSNAIHTNGGVLNFNAASKSSIIFNDSITSEGHNGIININASNADVSSVASNAPSSGTLVLNNDMSNYKGDVNLYHGTIKVGPNGSFFTPNNFNIYGCTLDFANGVVQHSALGRLSISDRVDVKVDADLLHGRMDTISASNKLSESGKINVSHINLLSDSFRKNNSLNFADENTRESVVYSGSDVTYSPLFKYNVVYDENTGRFAFSQFNGGGNNYHNYNPSVFAGAVAAQLGGYLTQLNSYDQAFMNIDMKMLMPKELRQAMKHRNKYAYDGDTPMVFSPLFTQEQRKGAWFRPYSAFESVALRGGPRVSNVMYGTFMGADSDMYDLGHGIEGQISVYAGYNGSHQAYDGVSLYQNGGTLGFTGALFKGNFFSAFTANAGAASVDSSHMFGSENFPMLMAGAASKSGYNWELFDGRFIIQPNYMMSYTFVNVFNYTNGGGVNISSDPLNAIQIAPGIKFIGNLKNGWQPYIGVNMVWNIIDKTKFKAFDTSLPELSIKPYVEYGVGLQKLWGEKFTGYAQTMLRNGGRNGVALSMGFRWAFGKAPKYQSFEPKKELEPIPSKIRLQCMK